MIGEIQYHSILRAIDLVRDAIFTCTHSTKQSQRMISHVCKVFYMLQMLVIVVTTKQIVMHRVQ